MEAASVKPVTVEADLGSSLFAGSDIPSSAESVGKPRKPPIKLNTVMEAATSEQDLGELSPLKSDPVIRFSMVNITVDSLPTDPLSRLKSILIFLIETLQHFSFPGCDQITTKVRNYIQIGDLAEANNILCRVLIKVSAESKLIVDLPTDVVDRILLELTDPDIDELLYDLYRQNDEFLQETGALGSTSAPRQPQFYRNGEESSRVIPEKSEYDSETVVDVRLKTWRSALRHTELDGDNMPVLRDGSLERLVRLNPQEDHRRLSIISGRFSVVSGEIRPHYLSLESSPISPTLKSKSSTINSRLITWLLFEHCCLIHFHKLSPATYEKFAKLLWSRHDHEKALKVLLAIPIQERTLEAKKLLILLYLSKRPKEIEAARRVLDRSFDDASELHISPRSAQSAESHIVWLFFNSVVRDANWSDIMQRYEDARINAGKQDAVYLDNAIMEVALNYRQFDAGWRIFEVMKEIDKHTLIIAVTLCWKAFMSLLRKPSEDEGTAELHETNDIQPDLIQWEARAWALYQRAQSMDHNSKHVAVDYITHRLIEIARESPQIESRREKLLRLQSK